MLPEKRNSMISARLSLMAHDEQGAGHPVKDVTVGGRLLVFEHGNGQGRSFDSV